MANLLGILLIALLSPRGHLPALLSINTFFRRTIIASARISLQTTSLLIQLDRDLLDHPLHSVLDIGLDGGRGSYEGFRIPVF